MTIYEIFSGDIPFAEISCWSSLRSHVVKYAKRPPKPQLPDDIGREFDDKLWSLIEECWSQEPSNRPTAATVSLRLGGVDGCLVNPAEMYKKEIAAFTEELARVKERSKAAIQYLETELAELKKNLNEERDLRKRVEKNADELRDSLARRELEEAELKKDLIEERDLRKQAEKNADKRSDERIKTWRQDLETVQTELAKLRDSLARRELEQAELKKDLNGERDLRKQAEKNADERSKAARQDLERELANLRNSLARQELEQAELKKGVDEENQLPKQLETDADGSELPISILCTDGPGVSPSEPMAIVQKPIVQVESPSTPNGIYILRNREENVYWCMTPKTRSIFFLNTTEKNARNDKDSQWEIIPDANGNISISNAAESMLVTRARSWVGAGLKITRSKVPWRLIAADDKFYYLTTDINRASKNPPVPCAVRHDSVGYYLGLKALNEGDPLQMWEFIRIH